MSCRKPILLVLASNTGNTASFLPFLENQEVGDLIIDRSFEASIIDYDHIVLGTYTWSNGKIPVKMKKFLIDNQKEFKGKKVFVFGSGNSIYPKFCGAVDGIKKIVTDCGASVEGTFKFEQRFNETEFTKEEIDNLIESIKNWSL